MNPAASRPLVVFLRHLVLATIGSVLLGYLPWLPLAVLNLIVNTPNPLDPLVSGPYPVLPNVAGLVMGYLTNRRFRTKAAVFVWVPPLLCLTYSIATWKSYGGHSYWADVWANFFGASCGDTECLYELLVTLPFYTSAAYSVGALFGYRKSPQDLPGLKGPA